MFAFIYLPSSLFPSTLSILLLFYLSSNFFSISFHLPRLLLTSFGIKPQDKNFRQRHSYRKQLVRCEAPLLCATHLVTACLHYVKYLDETAGNCGIKQSLHCSAHTDTRVATKSTKHSVWWDAVYGHSLESSYFSLHSLLRAFSQLRKMSLFYHVSSSLLNISSVSPFSTCLIVFFQPLMLNHFHTGFQIFYMPFC